MRSKIISLIALLLVLCLSFCSCDALLGELDDGTLGDIEDIIGDQGGNGDQSDDGNGDQGSDKEDGSPIGGSGAVSSFSLAIVAKYSGEPYFVINNNVPFFEDSEKSAKSFEEYGDLDPKGRCTYAYACIGKDLMPPEGDERGSISSVKPTGWIQASYSEEIGLQYLYNRAHLIGWQLTDEDANKSNLITGTREMNETMIPFENMVADYVKETGNHVLYRATPVYSGDNLVASGVLLEAYSVEDEGDGISFNVFIYNVQPQIWINYATSFFSAYDQKNRQGKSAFAKNIIGSFIGTNNVISSLFEFKNRFRALSLKHFKQFGCACRATAYNTCGTHPISFREYNAIAADSIKRS